MTTRITLRARHAWPIALLLVGTALAAAIAQATGAFASASTPVVAGVPIAAPAGRPVYLSERTTSFRGWATVGPGARYCQYSCPFVRPSTVTAYQWTDTSWRTTSRPVDQQIYVWPFAADWSWTWTADRGWLAMRDEYIIIDYEYWAVAT